MIEIINKIKELLKVLFISEDKLNIDDIDQLKKLIYENYNIEVRPTVIADQYIQIEFFKNDYKAERGVKPNVSEIIKLFEEAGYTTAREDTEYRILIKK